MHLLHMAEERAPLDQVEGQEHHHVERIASKQIPDREIDRAGSNGGRGRDQLGERGREPDGRRADERVAEPRDLGKW
jgi:hypothetical protein